MKKKQVNEMTEVVAALIKNGEKFLICQRPENKPRGLLWAVAGGKVEKGESKPQALVRECKEELNLDISVGKEFCVVTHEYPDITVQLTVFNATAKGEPQLLEHNAFKWITAAEIDGFKFCPADVEILEKIKKETKNDG